MADVKITKTDLMAACDDLATLPYFPNHSRASVMNELAKMCPHLRALRYVVDSALACAGEWCGLAELRGILCCRFEPADGVDHWGTLPGFTAADGEQKYMLEHEARKAGKLAPEAQEIVQRLIESTRWIT